MGKKATNKKEPLASKKKTMEKKLSGSSSALVPVEKVARDVSPEGGSSTSISSGDNVPRQTDLPDGKKAIPLSDLKDDSQVTNDKTVVKTRSPLSPPPANTTPGTRFNQAPFAPGDIVGGYELLDFVGGGGMGRVFRAKDLHLEREVALKILSPDAAADKEYVQRFEAEAKITSQLNHDHVVKVFCLGEADGVHYIAYELVRGDNVRTLVNRDGPLSVDRAIALTMQIVNVLDYMSQRTIVHRDIKPSNVLVTASGVAKLIDMGLARLHEKRDDLTASGVTLGTFDYISPEQARDPRVVDVRSDIYSLGCTFFFMLTGRPPFPDGTVLQKLLQHQGDTPPNISKLRPDLPKSFVPVLEKMLAKNPNNRYSTPLELIVALIDAGRAAGMQLQKGAVQHWAISRAAAKEPSIWKNAAPLVLPMLLLFILVIGLERFWWNINYNPQQQVVVQDTSGQFATNPNPETNLPVVSPQEGTDTRGGDAKSDDPTPVKTDAGTPVNEDGGAESPKKDSPPGLLLPSISQGDLLPSEKGSPKSDDGSSNPSASDVISVPTLLEPSGVEEDPPQTARVLYVSDSSFASEKDGYYSSIRSACAAANPGDMIELQYSGARLEEPFRLIGTNITLRAGKSFTPTIAFRPMQVDDVRHRSSMLILQNTRLTLVGVSLAFEIPQDVPSDRWALFQLENGTNVRIEDGTLTVVQKSSSSQKQPASFFLLDNASSRFGELEIRNPRMISASPKNGSRRETGSLAGAIGEPVQLHKHERMATREVYNSKKPALDDAGVTLQLHRVVARGNADFIEVAQPTDLLLQWENGILAVAGALLRTPLTHSEQSDGQYELALTRLTAKLGQQAFVLPQDTRENHSTTQIKMRECILWTPSGGTLIEQPLADDLEAITTGSDTISDSIQWTGERNFYLGIADFWRAGNPRNNSANARNYDFAAWKDHWGESKEMLARNDQIHWLNPIEAARTLASLVPEDFELAPSTEQNPNPIKEAASDGGDCGAILDELPQPSQ